MHLLWNFCYINTQEFLLNDELVTYKEIVVLADEVMVEFHVLASKKNSLNNITVSTFETNSRQ